MPPPLPPFALAAPVFRFKHLATLAARAPIGGAREVVLACFVAARLAAECRGSGDEAASYRAERCMAAKGWFATLVLPAAVRIAIARCVESSVRGLAGTVAMEVTALTQVASSYLDSQSRSELASLATALRGYVGGHQPALAQFTLLPRANGPILGNAA